MKRVVLSKKNLIWIIISVVLCIAVGITVSFFVSKSNAADTNIKSYQKKDLTKLLGDENNPYTIVEVVPDERQAMAGYLIEGLEPENLNKIGATDINNSSSAISNYKKYFAENQNSVSELFYNQEIDAFDDEVKEVDSSINMSVLMPGDTRIKSSVIGSGLIVNVDKEEFKSSLNTYYPNLASDYNNSATQAKGYSEYGYYTTVGEGEVGSFNWNGYTFVRNAGGNYKWVSVGHFEEGTAGAEMYHRDGQDYTTKSITTDEEYNNTDYIGYIATGTGNYKWVAGPKYNNDNGGNLSVVYTREQVQNDINNHVVGAKYYSVRTEQTYLRYTATLIKNKGDWRKNMFPDPQYINWFMANGGNAQVVTVTPAQLKADTEAATDLINTADVFMFHSMTAGSDIYKALYYSSAVIDTSFDNNTNDLNWDLVRKFITREAGATPAMIMFDESAVATSSMQDSKRYVTRLYNILNSEGAKYYYNVRGLDDEGQSTKVEKYELTGDLVGRSNFVYDFPGQQAFTTGVPGIADRYMGFANPNRIQKTTNNESAFEILNINKSQSQRKNDMSTPEMIGAMMYETFAFGQPRHLNILELQPTDQFKYDENNKDALAYYLNIMPWFIGTDPDITKDLTVTKQTTYEFAGKIDDINSTYDMIIFGGSQDESNGMNGYNDENLGKLAYTAVGDLITTFGGGSDNENSNTNALFDFSNNSWKAISTGITRSNVREVYPISDQPGTVVTRSSWDYTAYASPKGSDAYQVGQRYSGTDLTKKKFEEILDFAKQAPVIMDDAIYNSDGGVNTNFVDQDSFMSKLAHLRSSDRTAENSYQVYSYSESESLKKINVKKAFSGHNCDITFVPTSNGGKGYPVEFEATYSNTSEDVDGLLEDQNGKDGLTDNERKTTINGKYLSSSSNNQKLGSSNVLEYNFTVEADRGYNYGVDVYVDSNGNGEYEGSIKYLKERDANADNSEFDNERSDLIIFDETDRVNVDNNSLITGHTYRVTRVLPDSEVGLLPWKLEVYRVDNKSVRSSKIGYTRIQNNNGKKKIKVLQMNLSPDMSKQSYDKDMFSGTSYYKNAYKMDENGNNTYTRDLMSNTSTRTSNNDCTVNMADPRTLVGAKFKKYLDAVEDFDVQMYYMSNYDFYSNFANNPDKWAEYLSEYDMLIIGFRDMATFTNDSTFIYGFEKFKEAGKAIILSHDLTQDASFNITGTYSNTSKYLQKDVLFYLRKIGGQVKKYYNAKNYDFNNPVNNRYSYGSYYSNGRSNLSFLPNGSFKMYTDIVEHRVWGGTNYMRWESSNSYPLITKDYYTYGNTPVSTYSFLSKYFDASNPASLLMDNSNRAMLYYSNIKPDYEDKIDRKLNSDVRDNDKDKFQWGTNTMITQDVRLANEGQITKYPYNIGNSLKVAKTHTQNFQLDLEHDNDEDAIVWYNLSGDLGDKYGSIYSAKEGDSRNNYYVYTKGNVTYTGLGHSKTKDSPMTDDEIKLFINLMIASYRASASSPYVTVTNKDVVNNGSNATLYIEDKDLQSGQSAFNSTVDFKVNDDTTNTKILNAREYYVTVYKYVNGIKVDEPLISRVKYNRSQTGSVPIIYSEVMESSDVKYEIILESVYHEPNKDPVTMTSTKTVTVLKMPMFEMF